MTTDLSDNSWSWFNITMKDELALCCKEEHAEDRREYIMRNWLLSAPAAGSC
jgi:hypothetical protein